MNLTELSKKTGFSVSTLSKAFNGSDEIPKATKEKIYDLAKQYGCLNRYLKQHYDNKVIAVIVPETDSEAYSKLITTFSAVAKRENITLCFSTDEFDIDKRNSLVDYYANYAKVDGIIVCDSGENLVKTEVPIVCIGTSDDIDCVTLESDTAFLSVIKTLQKFGHKRIAFLGEKLTTSRQELYSAFAKARGFSDKDYYEFISDYRFEEAGRDGVKAMLEKCKDNLPTALLCAYDYIAIGAIRALEELGYKVPDDFSVVGVDDITISRYIDLSSINIQSEKRCSAAFDIIMKKLKNKYYRTSRSVKISAEFELRGSVGKAKR